MIWNEYATDGGSSYPEKGTENIQGVSLDKYVDIRFDATEKIFNEKINSLKIQVEHISEKIEKINKQNQIKKEHKFTIKAGIIVALISTLMSTIVNIIFLLIKKFL